MRNPLPGRYRLSFLLLTILIGIQVMQSQRIYGDLLTVRSGLSHSRINAIIQDSLGFLWIGTDEGLNKYDGYSFEHFRYQPDTISLSSSTITCITEGINGVLWVGTDNGLNKLDRLQGYLWSYVFPSPHDSTDSRRYSIRDIRMDGENNLWVLTDGLILIKEPVSEEFSRFELVFDSLDKPESHIRYSMITPGGGKVWIGTPAGLQVLDRASGRVDLFPDPGDGVTDDWDVRTILDDGNGRIWLGTDKGLFWCDTLSGFFHDAGQYHAELKGMNVHSLILTTRGDLLAGISRGFLVADTNLDEVRFIRSYNRQDLVINLPEVTAIFEDASEILWMATETGLVKIDRKVRKFNQVSGLNPEIGGLSSYSITSLLREENGDLWLGTAGRGLNHVRSGTGNAEVYGTGSPSRQLSDDYIYVVHSDASGNLWVGTGNGVDLRKAGTRQFYRFCRDDQHIPCRLFDHQHIYDIISDSGDRIWFAASNGVHRYDPVTGGIQSFRQIFNGLEMLELRDVFCLIEDENGCIWMGSAMGLIRYGPNEGEFNVYQAGITSRSATINSNTVYSLMLDSGGELWIGTASGLNRYDKAHDRFEYFADPVELAELRIYALIEDGNGKIWMSSDRGLSCYNPQLQSFISYGPTDGLQGYEFLPGSVATDTTGTMYFGGVSGLNYFHPDSIIFNPHIPPLSFTQFVRIREQGGQSKPLPLDRVSKVIVPRDVQIISIRFSALDFTFPERNRYMYRMVRKGQDGLWIHNGEQHHVTFHELTPGTYTLSVKGSNNDLLYNEEGITLEIVVPYSLWGKGFSVAMYILGAIILLYIGIQYRTRELRKSNRILREKEATALEISRQREELALKNKNITDSINYARRIQHALLPSWENFKSILPESFVLYKPKDIVSGDFYWTNQHGNKIYIAAVDCTGHGVPGAFVSIIGFELFRKITASEQGSNPAMILDTLNDNFTEIFSDGEQVYLNDGMDLSLCIIDRKEKSLDFAGAFNPLYLVRNETIIEVKADRFSVGADVHASALRRLFKSHKLYLQPDDIFYLFSDGYADQFGGPEGKKFKYRRFRHLLLTIHKLPLDKQESILNESIEEWMGDQEQVDDILVIGIRPGF